MTEEEPLLLTDDQRSILDWLRVQAPGCAEAFECALNLVARGPMVGAGSLVAHALRDMLNRLGETFSGARAEQVPYKKLTTNLLAAIDGSGFSTQLPDGLAPNSGATVPMPVSVLGPLGKLVIEFRRGTERDDDKELAIFVGLFGPRGGQTEFEPGRNALRKVRKWAQEKAHFDSRKPRAVSFEEAAGQVKAVEALFLALRRKFFDQAKEIDAILDSANA